MHTAYEWSQANDWKYSIMQEAAYQCVEEMRQCIVRKAYEYFSSLYVAILMMTVSISITKSVLTCMNAIVHDKCNVICIYTW